MAGPETRNSWSSSGTSRPRAITTPGPQRPPRGPWESASSTQPWPQSSCTVLAQGGVLCLRSASQECKFHEGRVIAFLRAVSQPKLPAQTVGQKHCGIPTVPGTPKRTEKNKAGGTVLLLRCLQYVGPVRTSTQDTCIMHNT
eukprot:XP_022272409.1 uncharacterized protein LOC102153388 isoform X2 [Canis lupus familiaris]